MNFKCETHSKIGYSAKKGGNYTTHGSTMPGRNFISATAYKFGYQGQEKDNETGFLNFELRQYDPRIGRWFNPDPMRQYHSPYLAMGNNPISRIDPTGGNDEWNLEHGGSSNYHSGYSAAGAWDNGYNSAPDVAFAQISGESGGSIGADGGFTSNDSWVAAAHELWKQNQVNHDYVDYYEDGQTGETLPDQPIEVVGYRSDATYDYIKTKGAERDKAYKKKYGNDYGYSGNSRWDYVGTREENNAAAEVELTIASLFLPVGELFQGARFAYLSVATRFVDVSSEAGRAVFWSGKGMEVAAKEFAGVNGLKTLEMTKGGEWMLNLTTRNLSDAQVAKLWGTLSERFAKSASGEVNVFLHNPRFLSVWNTVEMPTLGRNFNLTNIIRHIH